MTVPLLSWWHVWDKEKDTIDSSKRSRKEEEKYCKRIQLEWGSLGGAAVWRLPLAQGAILETRDGIPRQAPGAWSLLLPLPMSLPLSLSV